MVKWVVAGIVGLLLLLFGLYFLMERPSEPNMEIPSKTGPSPLNSNDAAMKSLKID
jgi:hypothetical protein